MEQESSIPGAIKYVILPAIGIMLAGVASFVITYKVGMHLTEKNGTKNFNRDFHVVEFDTD